MRKKQIWNIFVLAGILILLVLMIIQRLQETTPVNDTAVAKQTNESEELPKEESYISADDKFLDIFFTYNYAGRYETFLKETKDIQSEEQMAEAINHYYAAFDDIVDESVLQQLKENREPLKYDKRAYKEGSSFKLIDMFFNGDSKTFEIRVLWTMADGSQEMDRVKGRIEEKDGKVSKFFVTDMGDAPEIYYVRERATDLEAFDYHTVLQLNTEDHTFALGYDMLSSYLPYGAYQETGTQIVCKTDDGEYTFIFNKEGQDLLFQAEGSDTLTCNTGKTITVPAMENGDKFKMSVTGDNLVQKKYHLDLSGWEEAFGNPEEYYEAGEEVVLQFDFVATDTNYYFYLDGERIQGEGTGGEYIIRFNMPAHDAVFSVSSKNTMNKE